MFSLKNIYTREDMMVSVKHNGKEIDFIIKSIINKRNKEELAPETNMVLLNSYVDYKGREFKDKLFKLYEVAYEVVNDTIYQKEIFPLPSKCMHDILDMFDFQDVLNYIKYVYRLKPPSNLKDDFDPDSDDSNRWTRVQTYIKDDYLELAATSLCIKSILGPIALYGYIQSNKLGKQHKEYILFNIIKSHKIYQSPSFSKLIGLIEKVIGSVSRTENDAMTDIRIIEKNIPKEDLPIWVLSIAVLQKIIIAPLVIDTDNKNIVTRTYVFVLGKLTPRGDISKVIRSKKPLTNGDSDTDQESIVEAYRLSSNVALGYIEEMKWSVSDIDDLMKRFPIILDKELVYNALSDTEKLINVTPTQIYLLGWVTKKVIDPRTLHYIPLDNLKPLLAVAFTYLWQLDFKIIALLLLSNSIEDNTVILSGSTNRTQIPKNIKELLDKTFPYVKIVMGTNSNKEINLCEKSIVTLCDEFFRGRWSTVVNSLTVQEQTGNIITLPADLKVIMSKLVLTVEYNLTEQIVINN